MTTSGRAPSRLRVVLFTALFSVATFFVEATPTAIPLPRPEALTPATALAANTCTVAPQFSGHFTDSTDSTPGILASSVSGDVFGYISNVDSAWNCTTGIRYSGMTWNTNATVGTFDYGRLINGATLTCNWVVGSTDYLKANASTNCPAADADYALAIQLDVQQVYHNNAAHTAAGHFSYVHSDCETHYTMEAIRTGYSYAASNVNNRPGSNCDPIVLDNTSTGQNLTYDYTGPTGSIQINSNAAYTTTTAVTLNLTAADNVAQGIQMQFSNDNINWSGWETYAATKAWTLSVGEGTKTVYLRLKDGLSNPSATYLDSIVYDPSPATPTPPDVTCAAVAGAVYQPSVNAPCFFRPAAASTINLTASATDPQSGIAHLRFETLTPVTGWTPTPVLPNLDTATPYTQALAFSASAGSSTIQVRSRNGAGLEDVLARTVTLTADALGPTTTFSSPASGTAIQPSDAVSVQWTESDSPGAGVLSRSLQRQSASWNGTSCGTFANDPAFTATSATSAVNDTGLLVNTCYRYVQTLTDQVGNNLATTSGVIVRETLGNLGIQGQHTVESWDLGAGDSLAVNGRPTSRIGDHPERSLATGRRVAVVDRLAVAFRVHVLPLLDEQGHSIQ